MAVPEPVAVPQPVTEEALRLLFDATPFPITVTSTDGQLLYANAETWRFYGLDAEKDPQRRILVPEFYADARDRDALVRLIRETGEARDVVVEMRPRGGPPRWASFNARLIRFQDRPAILSAQVDVTERHLAEQALRDSEQRFAKAFENAPVAMSITDLGTGLLVDVNAEFALVTGFSREECRGRRTTDLGLIEPEDRQRIVDAMARSDTIKDLEFAATLRDGRRVHVVYHGERIVVGGRPMILSILQDVTSRRQAMEQTLRIQRLEALGVLAGGIAHDFNNLLAAMLGNVSLAREVVAADSEAALCLAQCERACQRARDLTHQLLTFARGGSPNKRAVQVEGLLREAADLVLHGTSTRCEFYFSPGLLDLEADEGQISQAVNNLLLNASQAMPQGGTITLAARNLTLAAGNPSGLQPGEYVEITVRDQGCGIPEANLDRIFDPYFTTRAQGAGLGLTTTHSVVTRHGGAIHVHSTPGQGTEFRILLPATSRPPQVPDSPTANLPNACETRVLVMDDEEMIRSSTSRMLTLLGFRCATAADGEEAIQLASQAVAEGDPFQVAILDLTVQGGLGGCEAAPRLRTTSPETVLLVSTGYSQDPVIGHHEAWGFHGVLPKPYPLQVLSAELQRVLAQRTRG